MFVYPSTKITQFISFIELIMVAIYNLSLKIVLINTMKDYVFFFSHLILSLSTSILFGI